MIDVSPVATLLLGASAHSGKLDVGRRGCLTGEAKILTDKAFPPP
jgi:hypothetical protein